MDLEMTEAIQLQNDLFMALAAALDRNGALKRDDLANYLYAVSQNSAGNRQLFFEMMAASIRSPGPMSPMLRIVD
jgi:hypothetical protein